MATVSPLPLSRRSAAVHTVLGLLALGLLYASRLPRFAQYGDLMTGVCSLLGLGSVAAARAYLTPRVRALLEIIGPTPPTTEEVKP